MITRYVDTASTAGGDGTSELLTGSTRAFASWREALVYLNTIDPLSDEATVTFKCSTGAADTLSVTQAHWDFVTSTANKVNLTVDPDHRHNGRWNSSKYRLEVTNEDGMYSNIPGHIWMTGFQVQVTATDNGNEYRCYRASTANNVGADVDHRFYQCVAKGVRSGTSVVYGWHNSDPAGSTGTGLCHTFVCLATGCTYGFGSDGSTWAETNLRYYNSTSAGNEYNYINAQRNINCIGALNTGGGNFVATGSNGHSNNASDDDSALGTNSRINQTFSFKDAAGGDFRLLSTDTGALGHGLDDPLTGLYSVDLAGTTWPSGNWSIGALGVVIPTAAVSGTITANVDETDIAGSAMTVVLALTDDTLVPASLTTNPIVRGVGAFGSGTTNFTAAVPTGGNAPQSGDAMYIIMESTDSTTAAGTPTTPSGWTKLFENTIAAGSSTEPAVSTLTIFGKIAGVGESNVTVNGVVNHCAGAMLVVGSHGLSVITDTVIGSATNHGTSTTNVLAPSINVTAGSLIITVMGLGDDANDTTNVSGVTNANLTGITERIDQAVATGSGGGVGIYTSLCAGTTTGTTEWDHDTAASSQSMQMGIAPLVTTPFADARAAVRSGLVSDQSEGTGWNARRDTIIALSDIVRTDDNTITITTTADAGYNITAQEVLEWEIPATALVGGSAITATPTFTIDPAGGAGADLNGTAALTLVAAALLTTAITFLGQSTATATASGNLTTAIRFSSSASLTATAAGALTTAIRLTGASTATVSASSSLTTAIRLAGTAALNLNAAGVVTGTAAALAGTATLSLTATGAMEAVGAALTGTASVALTTASTLTTSIRMAGTATAALTASSSLSTAIRFTGTAPLALTASGALSAVAAALEGTATASLTATSALTTAIRLSGTAASTITSTADLTTAIRLAGAATLDLITSASLAPAIEPTADVAIYVVADDVEIGIIADDVAVTVRPDDVVFIA